MKVITWETLYYEDHGATLKHKCGKRIVTFSLLSFSLIFLFGPFLFLWPLFFVRSLIPTCGGIIVSIILSSLGKWSNNDDHHTFYFSYNSSITTRYLEQNMTLYECLRRCIGICNESRVTCMKEWGRWLCHNYDVNYMIMQKQYDNDDACHNKRNGGKLHGNISRNGYGNAI